uniref:Uncharacterized protein n=1 Tax=Nymphaea colorata TaxID=210225 RepID=A0A5K1GVS4_9MAGN
MEAGAQTLKARSRSSFDIIHHTMWGYFSQRTGLLLQFEDTHLLRMKGKGKGNDSVFWKTSMESLIEDYRFVDGVNIAHSGHTVVTLFRYGHSSTGHKTRMEESWTIEEVDFNVWGLPLIGFKLDGGRQTLSTHTLVCFTLFRSWKEVAAVFINQKFLGDGLT